MPKDLEPGLAGGPGPTPGGFDDGTPASGGPPDPGAPPDRAAQKRQGEVAERSAGVRAVDVPGAPGAGGPRGDEEEDEER
jgi:hypothetical protein